MTKARDLANFVSGAASTIDTAEITNSAITNDKLGSDISAAKLSAGTVPTARLGSGTANSSTFLAGDSTYKVAATEYDDNKIVNDISTLALHQATNNNSAKYNLTNSNVDVYQDSSAIANLTNVVRDTTGEYISSVIPADGIDSNTVLLLGMNNNVTDSSANNLTITNHNTVTFDSSTKKFGSHSARFTQANSEYLSTGDLSSGLTNAMATTGDFTVDYWLAYVSRSASNRHFSIGGGATPSSSTQPILALSINGAGTSGNINAHSGVGTGNWNSNETFSIASPWTSFRHYAYQRTSGTSYVWIDGVQCGNLNGATGLSGVNLMQNSNNLFVGARSVGTTEFFDGYIDEFRVSNNSRYTVGSNFTPHTTAYSAGSSNATGSYESTAQTANASVNKISGVVTYTNASGTNTLNTDIVLQVSANNGSNWSNATLTAAGSFSSGVLQAVTNDISVTAGTQLKYKISFANQASGSKVARINGVSLSY